MSRNTEKILRVFLFFLGIYLICDASLHLFNIRLLSVLSDWPKSALSYAILLDVIYASFVYLAAILIFVVQTDLKKYKTLILVSAIWAFIHALLLIILSLSQNFTNNFASYPSLSVWMPFYNQYLLFEAVLAIIYSVLVLCWYKSIK